MKDWFSPLTDDEINFIDNFLLWENDSDDCMTLDILDGFLHAIAVGPTNVSPQQWLTKIWGTGDPFRH